MCSPPIAGEMVPRKTLESKIRALFFPNLTVSGPVKVLIMHFLGKT